jgi:probable rRNA maturation factor
MAHDGRRGRRALHVLIADEHGRPVAAPGLARWLSRVAPPRASGAVGVAIVADARARALNKRYRLRDYATDVLSFPSSERSASNPKSLIPNPSYLGDIVIARGVARRQAKEAGHSEQAELRVLALHGLLHLLGYDHEHDNGVMARMERRLRKKGGLGEGLIERTSNP